MFSRVIFFYVKINVSWSFGATAGRQTRLRRILRPRNIDPKYLCDFVQSCAYYYVCATATPLVRTAFDFDPKHTVPYTRAVSIGLVNKCLCVRILIFVFGEIDPVSGVWKSI